MLENVLITMNRQELQSLINDSIKENFKEVFSKKHIPECNESLKLLKTNDVCKLFGVSRVTIQQWRKAGKLKFKRISGKVYFSESDIKESLINRDFSNIKEFKQN